MLQNFSKSLQHELCNILESAKIFATLTLQHFPSFQNICNIFLQQLVMLQKIILKPPWRKSGGNSGRRQRINENLYISVKISRFLRIKRGGEISDFFTSPQIMFCNTFNFKIYFLFYHLQIITIFFFATFKSFSKIFATLTLQHLVDFSNSLQHFFATFMLQKMWLCNIL